LLLCESHYTMTGYTYGMHIGDYYTMSTVKNCCWHLPSKRGRSFCADAFSPLVGSFIKHSTFLSLYTLLCDAVNIGCTVRHRRRTELANSRTRTHVKRPCCRRCSFAHDYWSGPRKLEKRQLRDRRPLLWF
jgi:hypothetical protein